MLWARVLALKICDKPFPEIKVSSTNSAWPVVCASEGKGSIYCRQSGSHIDPLPAIVSGSYTAARSIGPATVRDVVASLEIRECSRWADPRLARGWYIYSCSE